MQKETKQLYEVDKKIREIFFFNFLENLCVFATIKRRKKDILLLRKSKMYEKLRENIITIHQKEQD